MYIANHCSGKSYVIFSFFDTSWYWLTMLLHLANPTWCLNPGLYPTTLVIAAVDACSAVFWIPSEIRFANQFANVSANWERSHSFSRALDFSRILNIEAQTLWYCHHPNRWWDLIGFIWKCYCSFLTVMLSGCLWYLWFSFIEAFAAHPFDQVRADLMCFWNWSRYDYSMGYDWYLRPYKCPSAGLYSVLDSEGYQWFGTSRAKYSGPLYLYSVYSWILNVHHFALSAVPNTENAELWKSAWWAHSTASVWPDCHPKWS